MPLTKNNIESELSYAYLHAVASRAGLACEVVGRHSDGAGVDAVLRVLEEKLDPRSVFTSFTVDVQLKATMRQSALKEGRFGYFLGDRKQFDRMRTRTGPFPIILVVLFLPEDAERWLVHSEEELIARRCAYWVSLWDAPASRNAKGTTVYLPQANTLSANGLREVIRRLSREEELTYVS